jgi:hypothetical protein
MKEEVKIFSYELSQIKDSKIREFTVKALENAPEYFWHVPSSSTGKYHPTYALGEGGLVRHTKATVRFALEMFNFHSMQNYDDLYKDIIISALLLHDTYKHGKNDSKYTVTEHPLIASKAIRENEELCAIISKNILETILHGIETHMTEWNTDYKTGKEVLPLPRYGYQKFIGLCDYLASRKCIEVKFEA